MEEPAGPSRAERYRQIMAVLAKHGIAAAGAGLRIGGGGADARAQFRAEQLREACEELGTTFIKLGQILSTRADLVPQDYRDELSKLQDAVPPLETKIVEEQIEAELGKSVKELFKTFDRKPLAAASIGQVHRAQLHDGTDVVVKVRKPGIRPIVERDLEILEQLAASSEKHFPQIADYDAPGLVEEFADTLRAELDYTREARNIQQFRAFFEDERAFVLPRVVSDYSTGQVLTLTMVEGEKPSDSLALSKRAQNTAAQRVARFVLEPPFLHGVFHADPHPGNILIQKDGKVGVIDFGMVGRLSDELRRRTADLFLAMHRRDIDRLTDRVIALAPPIRPVDRTALAQQLGRLVERYMSESLERIQMGAALGEMLEVIREFRLRLPSALALFFKMVAMSEEIVLTIAPQKTILEFLEPIAEKVALARLSPDEWVGRARQSAMEAAELSIDLPRRADRVLADVERGNLRVWARLEDLDPALRRLERMVERANATMIAAACIVGITVLFIVYHPQGWQAAVGAVFWIAIVVAVLVVTRTAWANLRRKR